MCECQPVPSFQVVDSPGAQCAGECYSNHYHVKQYEGEHSEVIDWRRLSNNVITNITFKCLPLTDGWIIEHRSFDIYMLNSHDESV